ncbi:MAG: AAA family ATPase [Actinobacteria bacterium]|nr:AAA family ATPase [Actinomycetota bacterium]
MRSIAITNQKGGVGKTTTTVNLGAALARAGQRVCLIDLDPQANLTIHMGLEPGKAKPSVYELLGGSASLQECLRTVRPNMDLVSAEIDLAGAEVELVGVVGREILLRDALYPAKELFDVLLIDCPPSLGLLTINALSAVREVFIALQPHFLALQGLGKLLETVNLVQRRINADLSITGVLLCLYDSRTALCDEVSKEVARFFKSEHPLKSLWQGSRIFNTPIRRNIRLAEAPGHGQTIFEYSPSCHGAEDYEALAQELLIWWGVRSAEEEPSAEVSQVSDVQASEAVNPDQTQETETIVLGENVEPLAPAEPSVSEVTTVPAEAADLTEDTPEVFPAASSSAQNIEPAEQIPPSEPQHHFQDPETYTDDQSVQG